MADTYTPNLNLKKPGYDSPADIADINSNMDKIDAAFVNEKNAREGAVNQLSEQIADVGTPNLLMNSNFQKPYLINLNGFTSASAGFAETVNGWITGSAGAELTDNGMKMAAYSWFFQNINKELYDELLTNGYTAVACLASGALIVQTNEVGAPIIEGCTLYFNTEDYDKGTVQFRITCDAVSTPTIRWAALVPGTYTAETLPTPIWLHPRLEMIRMGLPVNPENLMDNSWWEEADKIVNQRGLTEYATTGFTIDRWRNDGRNLIIKLVNGGLSITNKNTDTSVGAEAFSHRVGSALKDGAYTAALCVDGTIYCVTTQCENGHLVNPGNTDIKKGYYRVQYDSTTGLNVFIIFVKPGYTIQAQWAVLYEGAYTLETLPPYRQKENELAACMFRFFRWKANQNNASWAAVGTALSATQARFLVNAPCPMDDSAAASITQSNMRILGLSAAGNTTHEITSISCYSLSGNALYINVDTSGLTVGQTCVLQAKSSGAYVDFSRDL